MGAVVETRSGICTMTGSGHETRVTEVERLADVGAETATGRAATRVVE